MSNKRKAVLVILASLAYLIWPADFIPDLIPGLGQLDDFMALFLGGKKAWSLLKNDSAPVPVEVEEKQLG
jgi:uncharacterized membrane protein YkvA (DUF1232 family)